jgi:anti-anti-sigma factor
VYAEREAVRVAPSGRLDIATVDQLRREAEELIRAGFRRVILDLRGLTLVDSVGLQLLDTLARISQSAGCDLSLIPDAQLAGRGRASA